MAILVLPPVVPSKKLDKPACIGEHVAAARFETALVRTLLDEVDRLVPPAHEPCVASHQLADELTRLGCRLLDLARDLHGPQPEGTPPRNIA